MLSNTNRITPQGESKNTKVVAINERIGRNVPPARSAFVPKYHRDAMADAWMRGDVTLMKLVRSNPGLRLLDVEDAVRASISTRGERQMTALRPSWSDRRAA